MSKPLAFLLQLVALGFIMAGWIAEPADYFQITVGLLIAVVAGVGVRRRYKRG